ncbi:MAG TPA: hypothetical protein VNF47_01845 [Streptosporangiaceae bacterium]|nr:hypothetical protein [Streptosporangiaceae bacterium]
MAYAEKRGNLWRARWRGPDGTLESKSGFRTRKSAEDHARDQEAAIRTGKYVDPRAGRITLTDWVNLWFPSLDLELNTLSTYRYAIEVHILPRFGDRVLSSLTTEEIALWEKETAARGYTRRTAREVRSTLITVLGDAVPRYLHANPAARRRGKGRKGQRRIELAERSEKTWATPFEALLFAERCAALSGSDRDFVLIITIAYTGMRWSEAMGFAPDGIHSDILNIAWKLYELDSRFYRGRPKDGSIRDADLPPFLSALLALYLRMNPPKKCSCRNPADPWCQGGSFVFLADAGGHLRRGNYATRTVRPAADGWYAERTGRYARPAMPVLADMSSPWPGTVLAAWPPAVPGVPYEPPVGRGVARLAGKDGSGKCPACGRTTLLRRDGLLINHKVGQERCAGSEAKPGDLAAVANWLPLCPGLTPHGLRHGHQTWMDELGIRYVLQSERMGHEVPGMRGVYSHITPAMRQELKDGLQGLWEESLRLRARYGHSSVGILDKLLTAMQEPT